MKMTKIAAALFALGALGAAQAATVSVVLSDGALNNSVGFGPAGNAYGIVVDNTGNGYLPGQYDPVALSQTSWTELTVGGSPTGDFAILSNSGLAPVTADFGPGAEGVILEMPGMAVDEAGAPNAGSGYSVVVLDNPLATIYDEQHDLPPAGGVLTQVNNPTGGTALFAPEPSTSLLAGLAGLALLIRRKR